jgi:hypothetical protein
MRQEETMKYKIEVHGNGYEDHIKIIDAPSLRVAKQYERQAKLEWIERNDLDVDDCELPFTRVGKS